MGLVNKFKCLRHRTERCGGRGGGKFALVALAEELAERGGQFGADLDVAGDGTTKLRGREFTGRQIEGRGHVMAQDLGNAA